LERSDADDADEEELLDDDYVAVGAETIADYVGPTGKSLGSPLTSYAASASSSVPSPYLSPVPLPYAEAQPKQLVSFPSTSSSSGYSALSPSAVSSLPSLSTLPERTFSSSSSSYDSSNFIDDSYKSSSGDYSQRPLASKYFGVATTTSSDIQLGLTFTVPFLNIPLSSITDVLNGVGDSFGNVGNIFGDSNGLDTSNVVIIAVIALGAIFILPQILYWLTGVNLSAFNWGRSDDPNYMVNLANRVDSALAEYDVDTRGCLAHVMCKEMRKRGAAMSAAQRRMAGMEDNEDDDEASSLTAMLGYGAVKVASK